MSSDEYFEEDEEQDTLDEITENNPNKEKKDKCTCTKECSTCSCSCFKFGSGCNSSCGCSSSCENMFNHLEYFFGENTKYSAHPCFAKWLVKKAKNTDGLKTINHGALCQLIIKCSNFDEVCEIEEDFEEWMKQLKIIDNNQKLAHAQTLFRMLLADDDTTGRYYSFCQDYLHCGVCDTCTYGVSLPCEGCRGKSEISATI
ncbi:unnamed protein product [Rotaria sordida]|uniref:Tesmin/TSO1-like CXC domain-containing protein n=1 Tax=Rotaria sordida TaxID=392033 RepID=A0A815QLU3_9BILA|nr:unnamed protein product [Rotaria sordida]CAF1642855.1 unnamed protein product [Rotaria sordida]